jgi:hypothetical protein
VLVPWRDLPERLEAEGTRKLAKSLSATQLHTLDLVWNNIGEATQQLLVEQYPHIQWAF